MNITAQATTLLLVYMNDIIITGIHRNMIHKLQSSLQAAFHMKDLGPLTYFLRHEVEQSRKGVFHHQYKYVDDLIDLAGLHGATPVDTPLEVNGKLRNDDGDLLFDPTSYTRLVGSLVYLTITRPNISYAAVNVFSQFMTAPKHHHLVVVKRIIWYILGSPTRGLFFPTGTPLTLDAYSDAD